MSIEHSVIFATTLFGLIFLSRRLANITRLPETLVLLVLGFVIGLFATKGLMFDTGITAESFHNLIFYVFLPVLVFEAALNLPQSALLNNASIILFLAIIGVVTTTLLSAYMIYWAIGHDTGFPLIAALLTGALLAATDPVAVVAQLKSLGAPERLSVLMEGESLFNDATAITLFSILLGFALTPEDGWALSTFVSSFLLSFLGGAAVGIAFGGIGVLLLRPSVDSGSSVILSLALAYGAFLGAEMVLHLSGVMAVLMTGLVISNYRNDTLTPAKPIWETLTLLANGSVFLLMGLTVTLAMFTERWLAITISIVAIVVARAVTTFGSVGLLNFFVTEKLSAGQQTVMVWGGLRGGVTLALALALPTDLEYWWTIQSMAFGVVLFTLLVQAPSMPWILQRLNLTA